MPKINREEYEVLKELDDKWKWIARDEDSKGSTFPNELWLYEYKPKRMHLDWLGEGGATKRFGYDSLFQFIGDKDSEPYNIAELIKEYENSAEHVSHVVNERVKALGTAWKESEETEVKNIEWLNNEVEKRIEKIKTDEVSFVGSDFFDEGYIHGMKDVQAIANQLDEPEVLSEEWIEKHEYIRMDPDNPFVYVKDLQNLLVPKREVTEKQAYDKIAESFPATAKEIEAVLEKYYSSMLIEFSSSLHESIMRAFDVEATSKTIEALTGMTLEQIAEEARNGGIVPKEPLGISQKLEKVQIPQFVADWIEEYIEYGYDLYPALKKMENNSRSWKKTYDWYRKNTHTFVNAYLTGKYEVEEEQKYYARIKGWENVTTGSEAFNWVYFKERDTVGISKAVENKYQAISFTKNDWNNLGINEDNADFILVEELEE